MLVAVASLGRVVSGARLQPVKARLRPPAADSRPYRCRGDDQDRLRRDVSIAEQHLCRYRRNKHGDRGGHGTNRDCRNQDRPGAAARHRVRDRPAEEVSDGGHVMVLAPRTVSWPPGHSGSQPGQPSRRSQWATVVTALPLSSTSVVRGAAMARRHRVRLRSRPSPPWDSDRLFRREAEGADGRHRPVTGQWTAPVGVGVDAA